MCHASCPATAEHESDRRPSEMPAHSAGTSATPRRTWWCSTNDGKAAVHAAVPMRRPSLPLRSRTSPRAASGSSANHHVRSASSPWGRRSASRSTTTTSVDGAPVERLDRRCRGAGSGSGRRPRPSQMQRGSVHRASGELAEEPLEVVSGTVASMAIVAGVRSAVVVVGRAHAEGHHTACRASTRRHQRLGVLRVRADEEVAGDHGRARTGHPRAASNPRRT